MERERCCQARNATAARHWACDKAKEPGRVALHRLLSRMLLLTAAMVLVASVIVVVPAHASADVALNTYTAPDGSKQFISDGGTMPIGSYLTNRCVRKLGFLRPSHGLLGRWSLRFQELWWFPSGELAAHLQFLRHFHYQRIGAVWQRHRPNSNHQRSE